VLILLESLRRGPGFRIFEEEFFMKNFLFGLGLGIGLGVLFAPMSGEETRNNLSDRANDLKANARDAYEQNRERIQRGVESIRGTAERAKNQIRNTGTDTNVSVPNL